MTAKISTRFTTAVVLIAIVVGAMAVGAFASSHVPDESNPQSVTFLRLAHASPDAPAIDLYLDNESVVTDASFGDVTAYLKLTPGTYNVTVTEAGDREAVVFEDTLTLEPRTATTVAASGEIAVDATSAFGLRTFTDNAFAPGENASAVRVAHLSPDAPTITLTADNGSIVLAENVSSMNASDYVMVPAGNYTVEIRETTDGADGTLVATTNLSLTSGQAHTVWAMGYLVPLEDQEPFTVTTSEDATVAFTLPATETPTGNATETPTGNVTDTPMGTVTETPMGTVTEIPNGTATETET